MSSSQTAPLPSAEADSVLQQFHRDGFVVVRNVLSAEECANLRSITDRYAADPAFDESRSTWFVVRNPQDYDIAFARLFIREPIYSLVKAILGPECRFCGQNVIRNGPGQAISNWHVDDCNKLEHPLPPDVPRWPAGARLPLIWLSVQVPLSDITAVEDGPTEIVPGSHYSGRLCPGESPVFEGRPAEPILCRAGDIYLFNHQTWHRGMPNVGQKTRYLMQLQYARGDSLAFRCQGAERTPALMKVLENADPQLVQVMVGPPKYC
ncbi:phytanoyl-CoA dioxygenase family protein [Horticoccus luteus]|uniref:Phytanoyl-CoA dioxygenase family protein n=1 Tax=Horticoccus luteus TaxID=2862869 RepID=A0A8F9XM91_9BACT|nr:phytanoyl-CoA dioxygenase family protein [Horticoccus luteus]QYM80006.1 phytanoyl-CoA dioxygenase family protein [Horticoccus luteus]